MLTQAQRERSVAFDSHVGAASAFSRRSVDQEKDGKRRRCGTTSAAQQQEHMKGVQKKSCRGSEGRAPHHPLARQRTSPVRLVAQHEGTSSGHVQSAKDTSATSIHQGVWCVEDARLCFVFRLLILCCDAAVSGWWYAFTSSSLVRCSSMLHPSWADTNDSSLEAKQNGEDGGHSTRLTEDNVHTCVHVPKRRRQKMCATTCFAGFPLC